jgi:phosphatidate cytidylyltransferase
MSLKTRSITGAIFGTVMIGGTLAHAYSAAFLFLLMGICCLGEFFKLILKQDSPGAWNGLRQALGFLLGLYPALALSTVQLGWLSAQFWLYALPILILPLLLELFAASSKPFENAAYLYLGLFYIGLPTALLQILALQTDMGRFLIMGILLVVWMNDVFAYLVGSQIGKTKLIPRVSPGKTWEGIIGGVIGAMLTGYLCTLFFPLVNYSAVQWMSLAALCSVFGVLGDLVESILKRSLGIKDSGNILPGHGGFLDRFDAFLFVVPFAAFLIFVIFQDTRFFSWLS